MQFPDKIDPKKMELTQTEKNPWDFPGIRNNDLRVVGIRRMQEAGVPSKRQFELWGQYWTVNESEDSEALSLYPGGLEQLTKEEERERMVELISYWDSDVQAAINDATEAKKSKSDMVHIFITVIAVIAAVIASFNSCGN